MPFAVLSTTKLNAALLLAVIGDAFQYQGHHLLPVFHTYF